MGFGPSHTQRTARAKAALRIQCVARIDEFDNGRHGTTTQPRRTRAAAGSLMRKRVAAPDCGWQGRRMPDEGTSEPDRPSPAEALARTTQGEWGIIHPEEWVVSFFWPLPDAAALPHGWMSPSYTHLEPWAIDSLLSCPLRGLQFIRIDAPDFRIPVEFVEHAYSDVEGEQFRPRDWTNKYALSSSLLFHKVQVERLPRHGLDATLAVARAASQSRMTPDEMAEESQRIYRNAGRVDSDAPPLARSHMTVVEGAVHLRLLGEAPVFNGPVISVAEDDARIGPPELDEVYPADPSVWSWRLMESGERQNNDLLGRRLGNALDAALADVASVQSAIFGVNREPIRLTTRARLPFLIPFVIRRYRDIQEGNVGVLGFLLPHATPVALGDVEELGEDGLHEVQRLRGRLATGPFSVYLDLQREAGVSRMREGEMRGAAVFTAAAAESLLDELLLHVMWEEAYTPERAADEWKRRENQSLTGRLKRLYSPRLGGTWDLTRTGPVKEWNESVADLRHRVVHAGYQPSERECVASAQALEALVRFVGDRLAREATFRRFPRTAYNLLGDPGLDRRGVDRRPLQKLQRSTTEPPWFETFSRWRETWRRLMRDDDAPRLPSEHRAHLLGVVRVDRQLTWCLHDPETHKARTVDVDAGDLPDGLASRIADIAALVQDEPLSFGYHGRIPWVVRPGGDWVEEYRLVPRTQVMVDRSDFDR
jgi:hypothetical protein